MKPCLIIPCSNKKTGTNLPAIDVYKGALMDIIHKHGKDKVLATFEVFFLSAKLGLIHASDIIQTYNTKMSSHAQTQLLYALNQKRPANAKLKQYASKDQPCYVVLHKNYLDAFKMMKLSALKTFKMTYISEKSRGIGDTRGRLNKILTSHINPSTKKPVLFRSGCSNETEFVGYRNAGEAIGTSLHYLKTQFAMQHTIDAIKNKENVFVDNGLITAVTKGIELDETKVFEQYIELVKGFKGSKQTLSIVVPDSPTDEDKALETIKTFKKEIKWLAKRCNVIIPFHKPHKRSVAEQGKLVSEIIGKSPFTAGFPCRRIKEADWRLSICDIESLLQMKIDKEPFIKRVHFFALSEASKGGAYQERIDIAKRYDVECQLDCCRTTAMFGNEEKSNRIGSVVTRELDAEITKKNTIKSPRLQEYDAETEWDQTVLFDEIRYLTAVEKASLWNQCYPNILIDESDSDNDIEEVFDQLTDNCFHEFISLAKDFLYRLFTEEKHKPEHREKRTEAIVRLFSANKTHPIQQVMGF